MSPLKSTETESLSAIIHAVVNSDNSSETEAVTDFDDDGYDKTQAYQDFRNEHYGPGY